MSQKHPSPALAVAFKEWAVISAALAQRHQSLILRKGGISEEGGVFRVEYPEFLLYPTFFHEHRAGVKPEYQQSLEAAGVSRTEGTIAFTHFVQVSEVRYVTALEKALALDPLHAWTADVVLQRFHYRTPGLYVLSVRVLRLPETILRAERPEYAGCKTWVHLDRPVPTEGATPVLTDAEFAERETRLNAVL